MSSVKKWLLGLLIAILSISLLADSLYLVIKFCFPEKVIVNTFNVGDLIVKNEDGGYESKGKIIEVNYYANKDLSGVEMFELKLNTLCNENSSNTFSYGMQILGSDDGMPIKYDFYDVKKESYGFLIFGGLNFWVGVDFYNDYYYNVDGTNIAYDSTMSLTEDDYFLITIGQEKFRMSVKGCDMKEAVSTESVFTYTCSGYVYADWNYICGLLLDTCRSLPSGYDGTLTLKFADLFDYYAFDEEKGTYTKKTNNIVDGTPITEVVSNYYNIKVNTYSVGATSCIDSMFDIVANDLTFNLTGSIQLGDYSIGREIIELTQYDFDYHYIENRVNYFNATLKDNVKEYLSNKTNYIFKVSIDESVLLKNGINHFYFVFDDIFQELKLYEVVRI